jgi:pimeloyl-ACP methyl ester carboxylesterase
LHGFNLEYVDAGHGPAVLFVHGLLGTHLNWSHLVTVLSDGKRVIAPDLFGHGASAKPMGDYSLGAHAGTLRDLLDHLGVDRVTLVGHSLGGGIALQFTYLFPERVERLVLVSSGGLGRELNPLLRAATLPGAEFVLPLVASKWVRDRGASMGRVLSRLGRHAGPDLTEAWRGLASLSNAESRRAFLATSRAVIDVGGQTVVAGNRLALASRIPTLLVWGGRDRIIPPAHAVNAQLAIPGSRLEIFERAGHFPHLEDPERFARLVREFIADDGERSDESHTEELRYGDE